MAKVLRSKKAKAAIGAIIPLFMLFLIACLFTTAAAAAAANLDQIRNGPKDAPWDPADWVNGNAGASNAHYIEGYSIAYRCRMTGLPTATPITLILGYDIRHSSRNAIDYLTSYNRINNPLHSAVFGHSPETIDPTIGTGFSGPPSSTFTIPAPSGVPQPSASYANLVFSEGPDAVKMSLWGGTITGMAWVTEGDLTQAISEAQVSVTFTASSPTAVLAWGGHIASRADWGFAADGTPNSAGGISGSPYHMRLVNWYGTTAAITKQLGNLGNQDRSLSAVAVYVPPGRIIVDKVTVPSGSPQSFSFSLTGGPDAISQSFSLTDTATPYDSGTIKPGVYAVSETVPAGWDLTSAVCSDGSPVNAIDVSSGEVVTVTFTDTQRGKIIVDKVTVPSGSPQSFSFSVTGPMGYSDSFSLTDTATPHDSGWILPGIYAASETVPVGWDLTSAVCSDGSPASAIVLDPGETVTVTFTDTQRGKIIVDKVTVPGGDLQSFDFTLTDGPSSLNLAFSLTDTATPYDSGWILPGSGYVAAETVPPGWDLTSAVCSDGSPIDNIDVSPGETVTVTFTNTKRGKIIVDKVTIPAADPQSFDFTLTGGPSSLNLAFSLTDTATPYDSGWILPGSGYVASETVPTGWDLTSAICSDGSPVTNIDVSPGEIVTVTFTDTKRGKILVDKVTVPGGDLQSFDFTLTGGPAPGISQSFSLTDASTPYDSGWIKPGSGYVASETVPTGWDLTSAVCSDGSPIGNIDVSPGETVTVTVTNTKRGKIIVDKVTDPSGSPQSFDFLVTGPMGYSDSFSLTDAAAPHDSGWILPGTYAASETVPAGWDLTSTVVSDGSPVSAIVLDPGETVTVTFYDTQRGKIIVDKVTVPAADPQSFDFSLTGGPDAISQSFSLTDASTPYDSGWIKPGTYAASETVPTGWDLTSAVCSDGSLPSAIDLSAGETVTVTFTDTKRGKIIVDKVTVPSGSLQLFDFLVTGPMGYSDSFSLTDAAAPHDSGWILPGTYAASETVPAGWDLTSAVCSDGSPASAIVLDPGETVTVTFTDTQRGKIIVDKVTVPAADPQSFDFTLTGGPDAISQSFSLTDTATPYDSGWIKPGTYAASETVPAGWDLTSAVCSDGSPASAIVLDPGETVTVTFTDTKHVFYTGTIGYWMNHPEKWPTAIIAPGDPFPWTTGALAGKSYMDVLWTNPEGDASIQLARQYIGAKLNQLVFGVPADIEAKIALAEAWLTTYPAGSNPPKSSPERAAIIALAAELEAYNSSGLPPPN